MANREKLRANLDDNAIRDYYLNAIKEEIHVGDNLRIHVSVASADSFANKERIEKCVVTGMYDHVVTFKRRCGLPVSYTYQELIHYL